MDGLGFVLQLHRHILQLQLEFSHLLIHLRFQVARVYVAMQFRQNVLLDAPVKAIMDDCDDPEFAVGFDEAGVGGNRVKPLLPVPLDHDMQLPAKTLLPLLEVIAQHARTASGGVQQQPAETLL